MSSMFTSLLPFLAALKRQNVASPQDDDGSNPPTDQLDSSFSPARSGDPTASTPAQAKAAQSGDPSQRNDVAPAASQNTGATIAALNDNVGLAQIRRALAGGADPGVRPPGPQTSAPVGQPARGPQAPNATSPQNGRPAQNAQGAQKQNVTAQVPPPAQPNNRPPIPLGEAPPPPGTPALVEYNGHDVSDPRVKTALEAISRYFASSTVNVRSGDRDFVPKGGAKNSPHLYQHAADIHVMGKTDDQVMQLLKDPSMADALRGLRALQHGPNTVTEAPHIHIDSVSPGDTSNSVDASQPVEFMHEGMDPASKNVYSVDADSPRRAAQLAAQKAQKKGAAK